MQSEFLKFRYLTEQEFIMKKEIIQFVSQTCSSCVAQKKVLENIKNEFTDIEIQNVDIFSNYDLALKYNVKGAPTIVFLEDNRALKTHYGFQNENQVKEWITIFEW